MQPNAYDIREVKTPAELEQLRALFREYQLLGCAALEIDLCFQDFEGEMAALPGKYAPPEGRLYLAWLQGQAVGCGAFYRLEEGICELKRLYVKQEYSGLGIGRALTVRAMEDAKKIGYCALRLDSLHRLKKARKLYESLGFYEIPAYNFSPMEDVYYMEIALYNK